MAIRRRKNAGALVFRLHGILIHRSCRLSLRLRLAATRSTVAAAKLVFSEAPSIVARLEFRVAHCAFRRLTPPLSFFAFSPLPPTVFIMRVRVQIFTVDSRFSPDGPRRRDGLATTD
ncbi:hypothetical protein L596_008054 [Steinernema carpocapsae]|uniref:Uncharacterized protein n=1 Tax=Steinernema carpocapsae TaxID=34508 RepID=A0A4U5PBK7_STECR|nr:hypothetical protein L596_008054 [Steinernema carpocapsae]